MAAYEHVYLRYFLLTTIAPMVLGYFALQTDPSNIRSNYKPPFQKEFTPLAARNLSAWFLLSGLLRLGAWWTWGNDAAGFRGWYDACLVSLAVPVFHYSLELIIRGSIPVVGPQTVGTTIFDVIGSIWMWKVRDSILATP